MFSGRELSDFGTFNGVVTLAGRCERHDVDCDSRDAVEATGGSLRSSGSVVVIEMESPRPTATRRSSSILSETVPAARAAKEEPGEAR